MLLALGGCASTMNMGDSSARNQMVKAVRNYQAQSVEGGLGTGGTLKTN